MCLTIIFFSSFANANALDASVTGTNADKKVFVSGKSVGITMMTDGVIITKVSEVHSARRKFHPAADAGLRSGDVITYFSDTKVCSAEHIAQLTNINKDVPVELKYTRNGVEKTTIITPAYSDDDLEYKLGIFVRDSTSGIGTMTFVDPESCFYGALGHAICDTETGLVFPVQSGNIMNASIKSVTKGKKGTPGELRGSFGIVDPIGCIEKNTEFGIYGKIRDIDEFADCELVSVASMNEIKTGTAQILCTVDESGPQFYDIDICKVNLKNEHGEKGLVIEITDERLINITGGIVQGMSGSPIIQNGKLVGAVTHVLINDPTKGYGIFIENMLSQQDVLKG